VVDGWGIGGENEVEGVRREVGVVLEEAVPPLLLYIASLYVAVNLSCPTLSLLPLPHTNLTSNLVHCLTV
jgi:hypothetical protein